MTIIDGVATSGGVHCETTALGVLLGHGGLELSESLLFGLGAGLSFVYWDSQRQDVPFLGGRVKPFELTRNLAARLSLKLRVAETTSARKAWDQVRGLVDDGTLVGLQLDSHDLEYFGSRVHFAGHVVALYRYDDERAYLVDTVEQGGAVSTSLTSLARARAARGPMSARHRSFTVQVPGAVRGVEDVVPALLPAIAACAAAFVTPPIANLGNRGIRTAATRVRSWLNRVGDPCRDLALVATLMERAGTGGALFRNLYRDFLTECLVLLPAGPAADVVAQGRALLAESAVGWTRVAELVGHAGSTGNEDYLLAASDQLETIATIETTAMTALAALSTHLGEPEA